MTPEDVEKIKQALLPSLQETVKQEITEGHKGISEQVEAVKKQNEALSAQVKPIAEVYNSINTFGNVVGWFVKKILIPGSIVLGILLTYHNLRK